MICLPIPVFLAFVTGAWCLQQQAALPGAAVRAGLCAAGVVAIVVAQRVASSGWRRFCAAGLLWAGALALGFAYAAWRADLRLADALDPAWEARDVVVTGRVARLPDRIPRGLRMVFEVDDVLTSGAHIPRRISLAWYAGIDAAESTGAVPDVVPGERWRLRVRLRRPHGNANPYGFDYEGWLLEQGVRATGYVRPATDANLRLRDSGLSLDPWMWIERARARLRTGIERALGDADYAGVIVALVIGDQGGIDQRDWLIFSRTGISHLVSISGLHVTMLAGAAAALAWWLWRRLVRRLGRMPLGLDARRGAALTGVLAALAYCLIAGMGVPAQRTLVMLCVVALALGLGRPVAAPRVLALALGAVTLIDPWAPLAAGFWLSFGAVALIFHVAVGRVRVLPAGQDGADDAVPDHGPAAFTDTVPASRDGKAMYRLNVTGVATGPAAGAARLDALREHLAAAVRIQWAMTIGLVPLTLLLFHQVALISPIANAVAIPLVSFVVTPLALAGALLPGIFGDVLLQAAHGVMAGLTAGLQWGADWPGAVWGAPVAPDWVSMLGLAGVCWLLAPPGWPARLLGALALLPALFWPVERPAPDRLAVTVLDVGQGTAVLLETREHVVLYDTGPSYSPESDGGNRVILPYLRARGINRLDGMIVSHRDSDHSGGALSILAALPVAWVASSLSPDDPIVAQAGPARALRCVAGQQWQSGGWRFAILHPDADSYRQERLKPNARSCVLRVDDPARPEQPALLLTGDIERGQERALLERVAAPDLQSALLLVPHHGSLTSSSEEFLDAVAPRLALVQAGYLNRFGHPRPTVLERYAVRDVSVLRTDRDGAVRFELGAGAAQPGNWRGEHRRYWQGR